MGSNPLHETAWHVMVTLKCQRNPHISHIEKNKNYKERREEKIMFLILKNK